MTEQYKYNLLKYFTGNIEEETKNDTPQLEQLNSIQNNLNDYMIQNVENIRIDDGIANFSITDYLKSNNSDNLLIYGYYFKQDDDNNNYGFILILDNNMNIIDIMTTFSSGTPFRNFIMLNIAEDNTIYGVDDDVDFTLSERTYRFIMLNDIIGSGNTTGVYQTVLKTSYYFPTNYNRLFFGYSNDKKNRLLKKYGSSSYLFVGRYNTNQTGVLRLDVNVGTENEWNLYTYNTDIVTSSVGTYLEWTDDNLTMKIGGLNNDNYYEIILNNSTFTLVLSIAITGAISSICMQSSTNTYISSIATDYDKQEVNYYIYKVNYTNKSLNNIFTQMETLEYTRGNLIFYLENDNIFFRLSNYSSSVTLNYNNYIGIIVGDNIYSMDVGETSRISSSFMYVKNDYNLYKLMIQDSNTITVVALIHNSNSYNGKSFNDKNSLNPSNSVLYNANNEPIFARNLYNKTISSNITQSTLEVPNTYLNNDNIAIQNLLSKNNNIIISNKNNITKNIYETLYINFFNTIMIQNNNDNKNPIINKDGSIRLNNSISNLLDYDNAKLTKARINYLDNTNKIISFSSTTQRENEVISGTTINIDDGKNKIVQLLSIDGKSEQDGIPTPEAQIEIQTVKGIRNLYDKDNPNIVEEAYIDTDGTLKYGGQYGKTIYIECEPNTTYTFSKTLVTARLRMGTTSELPAIGVSGLQAVIGTGTEESLPIITNENAKYLTVWCIKSDSDSYTAEEILNSIQIEEGLIAHDPVPYGSWLQVKTSNGAQEKSTLIDMNKPNLFDKNNIHQNWFIYQAGTIGYAVSTNNNLYQIPIKGGNVYTIEKIVSTRFRVASSEKNINEFDETTANSTNYKFVNDTVTKCTINTLSTDKYLYLQITSTETDLENILNSIKVYEGYKPYYELSSNNDIKDILTIQNKQATINRKIVKIVLDGSESWSSSGAIALEGYYRYTLGSIGTKVDENNIVAISNYFKSITYNNRNTDMQNTIYGNGNLGINTNVATSTTDFKTWLSENPITVYYVLAEPQTIPLNGTYDIELFNGINNIAVNDELQPTVTIEYYTNAILGTLELLIYVGKKINNIELISNDEITVYQTIDGSNLEEGKLYKINQKVEVV